MLYHCIILYIKIYRTHTSEIIIIQNGTCVYILNCVNAFYIVNPFFHAVDFFPLLSAGTSLMSWFCLEANVITWEVTYKRKRFRGDLMTSQHYYGISRFYYTLQKRQNRPPSENRICIRLTTSRLQKTSGVFHATEGRDRRQDGDQQEVKPVFARNVLCFSWKMMISISLLFNIFRIICKVSLFSYSSSSLCTIAVAAMILIFLLD